MAEKSRVRTLWNTVKNAGRESPALTLLFETAPVDAGGEERFYPRIGMIMFGVLGLGELLLAWWLLNQPAWILAITGQALLAVVIIEKLLVSAAFILYLTLPSRPAYHGPGR